MHNKMGDSIRKDWIDIVKFWGMLAIVWGHTLSDGNVRHYLYSFHVPLFSKQLRPALGLILAMLLLTVGGITAFFNSTVTYLSNHYGNVFLFFASATFTVTGFCVLSIVMTQCNLKMLTAPLTYVGKRTLPILLMHKFPILFFQVMFPWTKQPMKANDPFVGLAVAIISIMGCLVVDVLLRKIIALLPTRKHIPEHSNKTAL